MSVDQKALDAGLSVFEERVRAQVRSSPEGHVVAILEAVEPIIREAERQRFANRLVESLTQMASAIERLGTDRRSEVLGIRGAISVANGLRRLS